MRLYSELVTSLRCSWQRAVLHESEDDRQRPHVCSIWRRARNNCGNGLKRGLDGESRETHAGAVCHTRVRMRLCYRDRDVAEPVISMAQLKPVTLDRNISQAWRLPVLPLAARWAADKCLCFILSGTCRRSCRCSFCCSQLPDRDLETCIEVLVDSWEADRQWL